MTAEEAYKEIGRLAEEHALIHMAYGGVIVVVAVEEQVRQGIRADCLYRAGKGPHPGWATRVEDALALHPHEPKF